MLQRNIHVVQPYWVGNKDRKSLAVIIPSQMVKDLNINASTAFAIRIADGKNEDTEIILRVIDMTYKQQNEEKEEENMMMTISSADKSFQASSQHEISSLTSLPKGVR